MLRFQDVINGVHMRLHLVLHLVRLFVVIKRKLILYVTGSERDCISLSNSVHSDREERNLVRHFVELELQRRLFDIVDEEPPTLVYLRFLLA